MASYQMPPPKSFNFSKPEEWPKWFRRFQRFRQASGLTDKSEENQVNTLVYTMGDVADDILASFRLSDEEKKKYDTVVGRFERHFVKKRNVIFEHARFNQRRQEEGESVDEFVTTLYCLSEHCEYAGLRDEMIRDRIVVGVRDSILSEKLQLEADLTLEKAVATACQRESVKKQQKVVRAEDSPSNVDAVHSTQGKKDKPVANKPTPRQPHKFNPVTGSDICTRCGKHSHTGRQQCPARDATCRKCHKRGHFQAMCRTKSVRVVSTEDSGEETFVGMIEDSESLIIPTVSTGTEPWTVNVLLNKLPDHQWKPVVYASRSLTPTEQKYAQIEKEALGITWACERFGEYLIGMNFEVQTDHKPLVSLLGAKNLEELPARIQRFRMRLMRFTFTITHIPGKDLTIADTLSRAPTGSATDADTQFSHDIEMYSYVLFTSH